MLLAGAVLPLVLKYPNDKSDLSAKLSFSSAEESRPVIFQIVVGFIALTTCFKRLGINAVCKTISKTHTYYSQVDIIDNFAMQVTTDENCEF